MRKIILKSIPVLFALLSFFGCSGSESENGNEKETTPIVSERKETPKEKSKGFGEITHVDITSPLDQGKVSRGKSVFEMKCSACHTLTADRVVGPGWAGVTKRRTPEWIMNMITNVEVMLEKDPEAQKLLELCLTRMPNQNVSVGDARDILEFMRFNDGEK